MIRFDFLEPASLDEAISLLQKYGDDAKVLAGGTDLLPRLKQRLSNVKYLINIKKIPGMAGMARDPKQGLRIGSLTTMRELEKSTIIRDSYRPLWEAACAVGSVQVRNLATVGGNLCHAAPSAETAPPLLALEAQMSITGPSGERLVPLKDFFAGPGKNVMRKGEILKEIIIPPLLPGTGGHYYKLGSRQAMDIAVVGVASVVTMRNGICERCRVALGAVAPTPVRAIRAENLLQGKRLEPGTLETAAIRAVEDASPISDHRGSAEYRREMVKALTIRTVQEAAKRAAAGTGTENQDSGFLT